MTTTSPFHSRPTVKKPFLVDTLLPPTRAPLLNAPTVFAGHLSPSCMLPHVCGAPSATVEQEKPDTVRRASGDYNPAKCGRIAALVKQNGRRAPCPPWPTTDAIGRSKSTFWPFLPMSDGATRPGSVGSDSSRASGPSVLRIVHRRPPKLSPKARHRRYLTLH